MKLIGCVWREHNLLLLLLLLMNCCYSAAVVVVVVVVVNGPGGRNPIGHCCHVPAMCVVFLFQCAGRERRGESSGTRSKCQWLIRAEANSLAACCCYRQKWCRMPILEWAHPPDGHRLPLGISGKWWMWRRQMELHSQEPPTKWLRLSLQPGWYPTCGRREVGGKWPSSAPLRTPQSSEQTRSSSCQCPKFIQSIPIKLLFNNSVAVLSAIS